MIAHIQGVVAEKFLNSVIVDVGGVGYEIQISSQDYDEMTLVNNIKLYTYHHIREQSQELYGFSSLAAKKLFELLITVQGVGPKAALAILGLASPNIVQSAIARSDSAFITRASGVGKRTAERVVVDLSDKVGMPLSAANFAAKVEVDEALDALMALGLNLSDAVSSLEGIDKTLSTSERVRQALKNSSSH